MEGVTVKSRSLLLMICSQALGEPLPVIDVKCVIFTVNQGRPHETRVVPTPTGSLTCLMGMARPLPMLSARASRPFLSLSVSFAFLDCGPDEITTVIKRPRVQPRCERADVLGSIRVF